MGYYTSYVGNLRFEIFNEEAIDITLQYFQDSVGINIEVERNHNQIELSFNDFWKHQAEFLEDVMLTIQRNAIILECEIFESGENLYDKRLWFMDGGEIVVAMIADTKETETNKDDVEAYFDYHFHEDIIIRKLTGTGVYDVRGEDIIYYLEDYYDDSQEENFEHFLTFLKKTYGETYELIVDSHEQGSYKIKCENEIESYYSLTWELQIDTKKPIEQIIRNCKILTKNISAFGTRVNQNFISDIKFEEVKVKFESSNGLKHPYHALFIEDFFYNNERGKSTHVENGKETSICSLCINQLRQLVNGCYTCHDAKILETENEVKTLMLKNSH